MSESARADNASSASTLSGRERQLAALKPWQAGQSGNPNGRPKALVDIAALAREHGPRCIDVAVALLDSDDERIRLATLTALLDRGFGRPVQSITGGDDAASITFLHLIAARASSDALNNRVFDAEHTDVSTDTNDTTNVDTATKRNLMEPAVE